MYGYRLFRENGVLASLFQRNFKGKINSLYQETVNAECVSHVTEMKEVYQNRCAFNNLI